MTMITCPHEWSPSILYHRQTSLINNGDNKWDLTLFLSLTSAPLSINKFTMSEVPSHAHRSEVHPYYTKHDKSNRLVFAFVLSSMSAPWLINSFKMTFSTCPYEWSHIITENYSSVTELNNQNLHYLCHWCQHHYQLILSQGQNDLFYMPAWVKSFPPAT